jgi:hypothetical protein
MATTVGGKIAAMERDCQALVAHLNKDGNYREATQIQGLLQQVGNVRVQLEQGEIADQEFPAKA